MRELNLADACELKMEDLDLVSGGTLVEGAVEVGNAAAGWGHAIMEGLRAVAANSKPSCGVVLY